MRTFRIEVIADSRPIQLSQNTIGASNHGVAARKAYKIAKPKIRRGAETVTIRVTAIKPVTQREDADIT